MPFKATMTIHGTLLNFFVVQYLEWIKAQRRTIGGFPFETIELMLLQLSYLLALAMKVDETRVQGTDS